MTDSAAIFAYNRQSGYVEVRFPDSETVAVFPANALWRRLDGKDITYLQRAEMRT